MSRYPTWLQPLLDGLRDADPATFLLRPRSEREAAGLRRAAVLVLFGDGFDGPDVLLVQRTAHLRHHAGQPAFPGGGIDDDESPEAAALREAQEETGLDPAGVDVLTTMPELWIPPTGNLVTPVVGWWREPSEIEPADPVEVASVARVPLAALALPANRFSVRGPSGYVGPGFRVADMFVWGFTAAVLDRLLALGGWEQPWDASHVEGLPQAG